VVCTFQKVMEDWDDQNSQESGVLLKKSEGCGQEDDIQSSIRTPSHRLSNERTMTYPRTNVDHETAHEWEISGVSEWSWGALAEESSTVHVSPRPSLGIAFNDRTTQLAYGHLVEFDMHALAQFVFLSRFTTRRCLADIFECGSVEARQKIAVDYPEQADYSDEDYHQYSNREHTVSSQRSPFRETAEPCLTEVEQQPLSWLLGGASVVRSASQTDPHGAITHAHMTSTLQTDTWQSQRTNFPALAEDSLRHDANDFFSLAHSFDDTASKTSQITERLKEVISHSQRSRESILYWSPLVENMCRQFFSPKNIRKFLLLFWSSWYPNCPIVHRPTFDSTENSTPLLASMVIIGACLSTSEYDRSSAKIWLCGVEEMVFNDERLSEDSFTRTTAKTQTQSQRKQYLEVLQAAYFVCLFQNWEGTFQSKRRIRHRRYNTLVAVSHDVFSLTVFSITQNKTFN
jgi:Fungal specific transcription factor domain